MKKVLIFISLIFLAAPGHSTQEKSYIIVKVSVTNSKEQPTWLCVEYRGGCIHLPTNKLIHSVKPGNYEVHQVDFGEHKSDGKGTQFFNESMKLKLKPGKIYFIGELELYRKNRSKYSIKIKREASLLENACLGSPKVFEDYMVTSLSSNISHKFTFSDAEN